MVVGGELRMRGAGDQARQVPGPRLALLLKLPQPPVITLDLLPELGVLHHGALLVKLEAADSVQSLKVEPALPPDTDTVEDERGPEVNLK